MNTAILKDMQTESVGLAELKKMLDRNLVADSTIGRENVNGVVTENRTVTVTPALAEALLLRNIKNRPLKQPNVNKIVAAMKNGEWVYDGTPITFDRNGNILNGQHRLNAVIKSNTTNVFKISTGFPPEIFSTMDIGSSRTGSEVLAIAGVENYKLCAQTANFVFTFLRGSISNNASKPSFHSGERAKLGLTHPELLKFVAEKPLLGESVKFYYEIKKLQPQVIVSNYIVSGLYFLFGSKDTTQARDFLTRLLTGQGLELDSPILHLRNKLVNSKMDKSRRLFHNEIIKLTIIAWNKYRNGEKVKGLKVPEKLPTIL